MGRLLGAQIEGSKQTVRSAAAARYPNPTEEGKRFLIVLYYILYADIYKR